MLCVRQRGLFIKRVKLKLYSNDSATNDSEKTVCSGEAFDKQSNTVFKRSISSVYQKSSRAGVPEAQSHVRTNHLIRSFKLLSAFLFFLFVVSFSASLIKSSNCLNAFHAITNLQKYNTLTSSSLQLYYLL